MFVQKCAATDGPNGNTRRTLTSRASVSRLCPAVSSARCPASARRQAGGSRPGVCSHGDPCRRAPTLGWDPREAGWHTGHMARSKGRWGMDKEPLVHGRGRHPIPNRRRTQAPIIGAAPRTQRPPNKGQGNVRAGAWRHTWPVAREGGISQSPAPRPAPPPLSVWRLSVGEERVQGVQLCRLLFGRQVVPCASITTCSG